MWRGAVRGCEGGMLNGPSQVRVGLAILHQPTLRHSRSLLVVGVALHTLLAFEAS